MAKCNQLTHLTFKGLISLYINSCEQPHLCNKNLHKENSLHGSYNFSHSKS